MNVASATYEEANYIQMSYHITKSYKLYDMKIKKERSHQNTDLILIERISILVQSFPL